MRTKGEDGNVETISFDEMSTLDVPDAALRSSLDKIASALQKVGAAGTDASAAVGSSVRHRASAMRQLKIRFFIDLLLFVSVSVRISLPRTEIFP